MNKQKDVIHNKVYWVLWNGIEYIVLYDETRPNADHFIHVKNSTYAFNAWFSTHSHFLHYLTDPQKGIEIREATRIEEKWLRMCIEAKKYVECPKEEVINDYAIY